MQKELLTNSPAQTKALAKEFARSLRGGETICLSGDLGAGKTTFAQALLEALGARGPFTSPTFAILKEYELTPPNSPKTAGKSSLPAVSLSRLRQDKASCPLAAIYHIDAYRINATDLFALGFGDFAGKPHVVTIVEWPENVENALPADALRLKFEWLDKTKRRITFPPFSSS